MRKIKAYYLEHTLIDFHVLLVAASFALWLVSKFKRNTVFSKAGYCLLFAAILSFILHSNLRGLHMYMKGASGVSYLPASRIRSMNRLFVLFYLLLSSAAMIILPGSFIRKILEGIRDIAKAAISRLLQFIFGRPQGSGSGVTATHDVNFNPADGTVGGSEWFRAILSVFQDVMKIVAIAFILYLVYAAVSALYRHLTEREPRSDVDEYKYIEVDGVRSSVKRKQPKERAAETASGPALSVRRLYKKTIHDSIRLDSDNSRIYRKKKKVLPSLLSALTPSEIESFAHVPQDIAHSKLHEVYEKARYSMNGVTDSDYQDIRKMSE